VGVSEIFTVYISTYECMNNHILENGETRRLYCPCLKIWLIINGMVWQIVLW